MEAKKSLVSSQEKEKPPGQSGQNIHIYRYLTSQGLTIAFRRKKYHINYPAKVWQKFPAVYHQSFADTLTYALTVHLSFDNFQGNKALTYHFPPPAIEPLIFKGMIYSLPEDIASKTKLTTTDYLKLFFNVNQRINFTLRPRFERFKNINHNHKKRALIPFTFGKDSLLSFALAEELGIQPILMFFREPRCSFENRHKHLLAKKFLKEFGLKITFFPVTTGWLREVNDSQTTWGWDLILTQYTLFLLPFLFAYRTKYLFWANEQSCNDTFTDHEGYIINPVFEQNSQWLLNTNSALKVLGCRSIFASLVEPLHEIAIIYILHRRYHQIAKYQSSCLGEEKQAKTRRWCGVCSKCARIYIFLKALGINPKRVGFTQSEKMLKTEKRHLYSLFNGGDGSAYDASGLGKDEQLLAFYLAYQKRVKGELMNEFVKKYLNEAKKREEELFQTFFSIHPPQTLTNDLKNPVLKIFEEELGFLSLDWIKKAVVKPKITP